MVITSCGQLSYGYSWQISPDSYIYIVRYYDTAPDVRGMELHPPLFYCLMVSNTTFNNISVISWGSVLLVEKTGGPRENYWPVADNLYHIMLYTSPRSRFELIASVVIATDCIGSCISNYHTLTAATAPWTGIRRNTSRQLKWSTMRNPTTCRKSLTNFIT